MELECEWHAVCVYIYRVLKFFVFAPACGWLHESTRVWYLVEGAFHRTTRILYSCDMRLKDRQKTPEHCQKGGRNQYNCTLGGHGTDTTVPSRVGAVFPFVMIQKVPGVISTFSHRKGSGFNSPVSRVFGHLSRFDS